MPPLLSPNTLLLIPSVFTGSTPSDIQVTDTDITAISLQILEESLKAAQQPQPEATTAIDLIYKYLNQINAITRQGKVTFEQINALAEHLEGLEEDLQTQAFNNFLGLCDLLNSETPSFEVSNIIQLLANVSELEPATLKNELTKNLAGVIDLLQAGFSFNRFILTMSPELRQYILKNSRSIAVLQKAGIPLHHLLELKKVTRQEVLEHSNAIAALKRNGIPLHSLLELKKTTRQEILEKHSQIVALLCANIPFESILELFPSSIFSLPRTKRIKAIARKEILENPAATIFQINDGLKKHSHLV